jgi:hypothetical protein
LLIVLPGVRDPSCGHLNIIVIASLRNSTVSG